jgi:hypothetical protein
VGIKGEGEKSEREKKIEEAERKNGKEIFKYKNPKSQIETYLDRRGERVKFWLHRSSLLPNRYRR